MLENTFCHAPGIGPKTERKLWSQGILSWREASDLEHLPLPPHQARALREVLPASAARLAARDPAYFYRALTSREHWRLYPEFRDSIAYLDIETTGLGDPDDVITTIVLYDGSEIRWYVNGRNLDDFGRDIARYRLIVTYNGKCFDVPFIRSYLGLAMPHAHIDLRYVLASLGYRGGLKGCERQLGIDRQGLADVDGFFAVLLWRDYVRRRNTRALETLLAYNVLDVVNLETLMVLAYNQKVAGTPFTDSHRLPVPDRPPNPFREDRETIDRLRGQAEWGQFRW